MRQTGIFALAAMLVATTAGADVFGCGHAEQRRAATPAAGITKVSVIARAGSLRVTGQPGAREIVANGTACASDKDYLPGIRIETRRDGNELTIEAIIPEKTMIFGWYEAKLDLEISVPAEAQLSVVDGSGSVRIEGTGPVTITDGSGEIEIRNVRGAVEVRDGSGSLEILNVTGNISIIDGSGSIGVNDVQGDVIVRADGSGSIDVTDVRGDFIVQSDGSGGVDYSRVTGTIRIPRD
jgi:hypothetical protein